MERKRNLTFRESLSITSMLFGMFFGAGNLIFPAKMGQQAGSSLWLAMAGMFITGVGLPLLCWILWPSCLKTRWRFSMCRAYWTA